MSVHMINCCRCQAVMEIGETTFSLQCGQCGQWFMIDRSGPVPQAEPFGTPEPAGSAALKPSASNLAGIGASAGAYALADQPPLGDTSKTVGQLEEERQQAAKQTKSNEEELARLDREWAGKRRQLLAFDIKGNQTEPNPQQAILVAGGGMVAALLMYALNMTLLALLLLVAGMGFAIYQHLAAQKFQEAYNRYRRQRRTLTGIDIPPPTPANATTNPSPGVGFASTAQPTTPSNPASNYRVYD